MREPYLIKFGKYQESFVHHAHAGCLMVSHLCLHSPPALWLSSLIGNFTRVCAVPTLGLARCQVRKCAD